MLIQAAPRRARHAVGDRIAEQEQNESRERGDPETAEIGKQIESIREQVDVVVQGKRGEEILQPGEAG